MSFKLSELILEATLRDGLSMIKSSINTSTDKIEDIFGSLKDPWLATYFGQAEIDRIKDAILNKPISIVQGYPLTDLKEPTIAINLINNQELESYASFEDYQDTISTDITPQVIKANFTPLSYDLTSGMIDVTGVLSNLNGITLNSIFVDGNGDNYPITGGITDEVGDKHFLILSGFPSVNLTNCNVISNVSYTSAKSKATRESEDIQIKIITEDALLTKYLYTIIKYIILSYKKSLILRGVELSTYYGTDFDRGNYLPENLFTRDLNLKIKFIEQQWTAEDLPVLGETYGVIKVPRDLYKREDENTLTIQTTLDY